MIGRTLAHYEIIAELGKGGMGEVWRARDTKLGRDVAIKGLPEAFAQDEERLARFEREAKLLASLNHPNIASIYGLEESEGTRFLVLELVEGETLAERLSRGLLPPGECMRLALQIVEALEAAHEKGVVHRDLKPANIKITPDGKVKVLDFGLAKAFAGEEVDANLSNSPTLSRQATMQGVILGTAGYMSPEQAKGLPADRRSDLFSFGCVLFEMLSGRRAFRGELATEILASVINQEPDVSQLPVRLHPRLRSLLDRCLEKDPKNRWQAAGDIRVELTLVASDPEGARERPPADARPSILRMLPWVAVTALATWLVKPAPSPEPRTVSRFVHTLAEDQEFTNVGRSLIALSPDGRRFVYVANRQLYLRAFDDLEARAIPGSDGPVTSPVFSPDGEWVAYWAQEQVRKIPVAGGAAVVLCDATNPLGMSWGADGTILFGQPEGVFQVPDAGGTPSVVVAAEEGEEIYAPRMLPGGNAVLFTPSRAAGAERWDEAQIVVQPLDGGERKVLWSGGSDARYVATGHLLFAHENDLFALPFDLESLEVSGGAVPITGSIQRTPSPTTQTGSANYDVSASGTLVHVVSAFADTRSVLALHGRDGARQVLDVPPALYESPRISPDGARLAVQSLDESGEGTIWTYELGGETAMRRLTDEGHNSYPIWTPDGQHITFASVREGRQGIYWTRADGTGAVEQLTQAEEGLTHTPESWSPDGRWLALSIQQPTGETLWALSLDEQERLTPVSETLGSFGAAFSPDGKWIAYHVIGDEFQIYVQPFPSNGPRQRLTLDNGVFPVWSADGKTLYFRSSGGTGRLRAMDLATEPVLRFSEPREIPVEYHRTIRHRGFDVAPDDERFLIRVPADGASSAARPRGQIRIVLNWTEELKTRVPVSGS